MTDRELMQQALEALSDCTYDEEGYCLNPDNVDAILALRERLAQPDQWQGLTDDDVKAPIQRAMQYFGFDSTQYSLGGAATIGFLGLVKEIEAKLREKNK